MIPCFSQCYQTVHCVHIYILIMEIMCWHAQRICGCNLQSDDVYTCIKELKEREIEKQKVTKENSTGISLTHQYGCQVLRWQHLALARAHQCEGRSHPFCISPLSCLINWVTKMPVECIMQDPHHQHTQSFLNSLVFFFESLTLLSPSLSLASSGCVPSAYLHILDIHDRHGNRKKDKI